MTAVIVNGRLAAESRWPDGSRIEQSRVPVSDYGSGDAVGCHWLRPVNRGFMGRGPIQEGQR